MKNFWIILILMLSGILYARPFHFQYEEGDQYRVLGEVDQEIYFNGDLIGQARILNRITFEIDQVEGSRAYIKGMFFVFSSATSLDSEFVPVTLETTYPSEYWRDERGRMEIDSQYLMPVVRNVPVFPERTLSPGDTWTDQGREVHDMRESFGSSRPIDIPITVNYTYLGPVELEEGTFQEIQIEYTIFSPINLGLPSTQTQPRRMTGFSKQRLFWDDVLGRPHSYEESYALLLYLNTGDVYEFRGTASSGFLEAPKMDREKLRGQIEEELKSSGVEDVKVDQGELGVRLTLDDLRFYPNSDVLLPGEEDKLQRIGEILSRIPERDILIEGHSALAGTPEGQMEISIARASAIGSYFLRQGVRDQTQLIIRGHGASRPVAPNNTDQGMMRNRRVEITVMEN